MNSVEAVIYLAILVIELVAGWKIFTKAGQPGWAVIIPIYNIIVLIRIVGRPWWWLFLLLIPIVSIVFGIIVGIDLAKSFGRGSAFGVFLYLLSFIWAPILAFSSSQYIGPQGEVGRLATADPNATW